VTHRLSTLEVQLAALRAEVDGLRDSLARLQSDHHGLATRVRLEADLAAEWRAARLRSSEGWAWAEAALEWEARARAAAPEVAPPESPAEEVDRDRA
jgi:hypothetical protein